jgi:hypothetical protein
MDPDPDPAIFVSDLQGVKKKVFLLEGTFTSFFGDKKSLKSSKTIEINVFLTMLDD